jgi:hypothetical protein
LLWFPTKFKEYNIVYMILLPTDGMEVHWQCTSCHSSKNTNGWKFRRVKFSQSPILAPKWASNNALAQVQKLLIQYSGSQTFDEDWWTMLIESSIEWTLNQSYEFKVINSLSTPRPKTMDETLLIFCPMHQHQRGWGHICIQHNISYTVQNSSGRQEEWGSVDSLHWMFMGWHLCSSL